MAKAQNHAVDGVGRAPAYTAARRTVVLASAQPSASRRRARARRGAGYHRSALGPYQLRYRGSAATPIKHVVVIFDENVSFDHYFGTYPNAANTDGTTFHAKPDTPTVNGLSPTRGRC